ncbi:hypothetical protein HDIA_0803 [Hartmannibacter diazotrophicus]|uniref:Uncharacterized protein n=1 Tax=Hartmannibacter diazotrophicus TaxID=1482074 RepID=A0A2C9D275_9HYPH|nr:hypothetical protein HDIA_0803 [Hartmannibacter diazotrophicus]
MHLLDGMFIVKECHVVGRPMTHKLNSKMNTPKESPETLTIEMRISKRYHIEVFQPAEAL